MYTKEQLAELVNRAISSLSYPDEAPQLFSPVSYVLSSGGKRLRPVMALMACNLFTDRIDDAIMPVTGLEIFHNFTLVHDDIMDQAAVRRNAPTVHKKWNTNQAILSGDAMVFLANNCFLDTPAALLAEVLRIYNKAAIDVCMGQQKDMDFEKVMVISEEDYLKMIELKTAVLLAASCQIGALAGGADMKNAGLLYEFGKNLGIAFQIQDDLLDLYGNERIFGKTSGGDIVSNKKTFLFVKAMELASSVQLKGLHELYAGNGAGPEEKIKRVKEIYDKLGIKEITKSIADDYINASFRFLDRVEVRKERREELARFAGSLTGREH
ncbi:MAG TPA: polyprenyl synthetase family protein [Bacteroidales bacterium]|nr:polyprenyl synthetase family protein [Bacteroidales bacterium]